MRLLSILYVLLVLTAFSCKLKNDNKPGQIHNDIVLESYPGECPYLTTDTKGNTVLSWVRILPDSSTLFCYSYLKDGSTFSSPILIPGTNNIQPHGENLPKIIFKPSGEIIALWGVGNPNPKNKYSGLVYYVQSFDEGKSWTKAKPLTNDTASFDQRYYDVALLSNGEVGIIWLDNRKTTKLQGSGLYFATTEVNKGFIDAKLISQPCCQCCRTDLFIDKKGSIHAIFRGILKDSIRDMVHIVSTSGGKEFSEARKISDDNWVINGCPHTGPTMAETEGGLQFAWYTGGKEMGCFFATSKDNGNSYSHRSAISENGSHPQMTAIGNEVLIVWDEATRVGSRSYRRIGMQRRYANGLSSEKEFLTKDTTICTYPVISVLGDKEVIVAYTLKGKKGNEIRYQIIKKD